MSVSIERKRHACFAWLDQAHRTSLVRGVSLPERGRIIRSADYVAPIGASEERFARGIGTRGNDAMQALAFPTVRPIRNGTPAERVLVSSARFLAWFLPRFYAHTVPVPTVARDAGGAVAYAGLVDVGRVGYDRYLVTPRDAVPTWEVDLQATPSPTPAVKRFNGTPVAPYGRLSACEYSQGLAHYKPVSMVPEGVYQASLADPMAYFPGAMSLGRDARDFLAERGEKMPLVDVYDIHRHRWHSGPDRVAHRGTARVRRPAPNRYQRGVREVIGTDGRTHLEPALHKVLIGTEGQYELETRLSRRYYCSCGPIVTPGGIVIAAFGGYNSVPAKCRCEPRGWIGHRRVTFALTARGKIAQAKATKTKIGRRAPNTAGPWSIHAGNLARATRLFGEQVATLENQIRRAGEGETIRFADGTRVVVHAAQVFDGERLRMYPIREWCRRSVLATLADS